MLEELSPLDPVGFFSVEVDVGYSKKVPSPDVCKRSFLLPQIASLSLAEETFASCALLWNEEGLHGVFFVQEPIGEVVYPQFSSGSAIELFIDTRGLKTAGFLTRFCHHFLFLPREVAGVRALEITRFRTDDAHPLCNPSDLDVVVQENSRGYSLAFSIPSDCLHGYDPVQCARLGWNYRIHRRGGGPQHFITVEEKYPIEQQPKVWGSVTLRKE